MFLNKLLVLLALVSHGLTPIFLQGHFVFLLHFLNFQLFLLTLVYIRVLFLVLCYNLYISELPKIISSFSLNDDSYIYSTYMDSSLDFILNNINSCLTTIIYWSSSMRLKLNLSKFELIYFDKSSKSSSFPIFQHLYLFFHHPLYVV